MLWVLLITLLIRTLSGGPEDVFLVPKLEKQLKTHVVDKGKRDELIQISKTAKSEIKTFKRHRKNKLKEIDILMKNRSVPSGTIYTVYESYQKKRVTLQMSLIDKRLRFQELFTDDEWDHIIAKAVFPSDKKSDKAEKQDGKQDKVLDEYFAKIKKEVEQHVSDPDKLNIIFSSMDEFQHTFDEFLEEGQNMNVHDSDILRNKHASREELEQFYDEQNALRNKGSQQYMDLRTVAIENTDEKEWKAIEKALSSILSE